MGNPLDPWVFDDDELDEELDDHQSFDQSRTGANAMAKKKVSTPGIDELRKLGPVRRQRSSWVDALPKDQREELELFREQYRNKEWEEYQAIQLYSYWKKRFALTVMETAFFRWLKQGE